MACRIHLLIGNGTVIHINDKFVINSDAVVRLIGGADSQTSRVTLTSSSPTSKLIVNGESPFSPPYLSLSGSLQADWTTATFVTMDVNSADVQLSHFNLVGDLNVYNGSSVILRGETELKWNWRHYPTTLSVSE